MNSYLLRKAIEELEECFSESDSISELSEIEENESLDSYLSRQCE